MSVVSSALPRHLEIPGTVEQYLFTDPESMARALAIYTGRALEQALEDRQQAGLLVSGGRSPVPIFEALSRNPLRWDQVTIGLVDERLVAADDSAANERLIHQHLLVRRAQSARFIPMLPQADDQLEAAPAADQRYRAAFEHPADVVLLGMGEDGHFASLFPCAAETPAAMRSAAMIVQTTPRNAPHQRLTHTLPALLRSSQLILQIQGESKRAVLETAARTGDVSRYPIAALLQQAPGRLRIFYCN